MKKTIIVEITNIPAGNGIDVLNTGCLGDQTTDQQVHHRPGLNPPDTKVSARSALSFPLTWCDVAVHGGDSKGGKTVEYHPNNKKFNESAAAITHRR